MRPVAGGTPALPARSSEEQRGAAKSSEEQRRAARSKTLHTTRPDVRDQHRRSSSSPWRSRGYLPHFDQDHLIQSITFRLVDSLPRIFLDRCEKELAVLPPDKRQTEKEKRIAVMLDRGFGKCHLRDPRIAEVVENALLYFDEERYRLLCWCIMPNHVHSVIEVFADHPLDEILHSWKSFTSKRANQVLRRTGTFWQREYHDRFIRDDDHFANTYRYIEENPVKARLVAKAEDWRWSSAWQGRS